MHSPHQHTHHHAHDHAHPSRIEAGISLLRFSAAARMSVAFAFSMLIWLIVYLVAR